MAEVNCEDGLPTYVNIKLVAYAFTAIKENIVATHTRLKRRFFIVTPCR